MKACNFIRKEIAVQMFSCELCELLRKPIFKNINELLQYRNALK